MHVDCRTVLIADEPSESDEFGPHQRVADAVVDLLTTQTGGKVVALEGPWGAGKTTVLNLIRGALAEASVTSDWAIALIDVWAHEGDPLRRTFLETVSEELHRRNWWPKSEHEELRDNLSRRRKVVERETSPRLTHLGVAFSLAVLVFEGLDEAAADSLDAAIAKAGVGLSWG